MQCANGRRGVAGSSIGGSMPAGQRSRHDRSLTVVTYMPSGEILGVDVLINANKNFSLLADGADEDGATAHDLGAVLTHELGHVLGLDESDADEHATMWPYVRAGEQHQRSLAVDDEEGVIAAYSGAGPAISSRSALAAPGERS
jgi:hypothetical protein